MKRFVSVLALAGLTVGLALPIVAQDKPMKGGAGTEKDKDKICKTECGCECVAIDKPFAEVAGRIPEALRGAGLILAAEIDWAKLGAAKAPSAPGMPGEINPRLDAATANVKTFLIADDALVTEVRTEPAHALWIGKMVIFEKDGETQLLYVKPSLMAEQFKKTGAIPADKLDDHMKKTREYEKKLEQAVNAIKK